MNQDYLNDPEFQELIRQYIDYLEGILPEVKSNLSDKEFQKVQKFGHNLKGSGGGYGLTGMSEIGKNIEVEAKNQDNAKLVVLLGEFEEELKSAKDQFKNK